MAWCLVAAAIAVLLFESRRGPSAAPLPPLLPTATSAAPAATVDAAYFGNTQTHKFHRKSCRFASCRNCTAKFATRDEALAAGYRPCGICDP